MSKLSYIIENEYFITCRYLNTDEFIKYCRERNISISKEELEKYEKLGIFYPYARVRYQKIKIKVEYINDGKQYKHLGVLKDGEKWEGETKEEYASFEFDKEYALSWQKDGYLWEPSATPFMEWKTFNDADGHKQIESFYSIFQCYELKFLLSLMRTRISAVNLFDNDTTIKNLYDWAKNQVELCKKWTDRDDKIAYICQVLSNRYYPETQTDQRSIHMSLSGFSYHNWDWYEYCRGWNAKAVFDGLKIDVEELKKMQEVIARTAGHIDPLEKWYELVSFVSISKKEKLKNDALYAQTLYSMEHMLRLFYKDITNKELLPPDASMHFDKNKYYGDGVINDELQYLEYIANQYNLNPRPRLILVVEGEGEECQFPRLARELFNMSFPILGIEVLNLHGIGNFTGDKSFDKHGALEKFIDYYHNRQTIVFVVLDNEGHVSAIKQRLVKAKSKLNPIRHVTKNDYIYVWNKSVEFDNFNSFEIAYAMTKLSENRYKFTSAEVDNYRTSFGREGNPLGKLFKDKLGYGMGKPKLLEILFSPVISNPSDELDDKNKPKRDVGKVLLRIIELASKNNQPSTREIWKKNQASGLFGDLI